jgi:hypothetical protein
MRSGLAVGAALCGLLLVVVPSKGLAAPGPAVQPYLLSVSRLHEALAFERALEQLVTARRLSSGVEDDVALSLWEGILMAEMGWKEEAAAAFKAALFLQPDAALPTRVAPVISEQLESLRGEVKQSLARRPSRSCCRPSWEARSPPPVACPGRCRAGSCPSCATRTPP